MSDYTMLIEQFQQSVLNSDAKAGDALASAKPKFSGKQQLQAYIDAYHIRLQKVLAKDYPALTDYWGEKVLNQHTLNYIRTTQSRSWNLNHYTPAFASYVETQQQDAFATALAKLEATLNAAYQAEDSEPLTMEWLQNQAEDYLMTCVLHPRTALHLIPLPYDTHSYLSAFRAGDPTAPEKAECCLAVNRHNNTVRRIPLEKNEYQLLHALSQGKTLPEALEADMSEEAEKVMAANLQTWLGKWLENGFFRLP